MTSITRVQAPLFPAIESISIFRKIAPFLAKSDVSSLEVVNKTCQTMVAIISKTIPYKDAIITDCYGDFVLLDSEGPVTREIFNAAFEHMNALLPQVDQTPRDNRLHILNNNIKKIKPTLTAFCIPRTLYESYYVLSAYREEINLNGRAKKMGCSRKDTEICWHSHKFDNVPWADKYPLNPVVVELAFRLNHVILKELHLRAAGLTEEQCIKAGQAILKECKKIHQQWIRLKKEGYTDQDGIVHIGPILDPDRLKQAISLESSPRAHNAFIIYRGSRFNQEPLFTRGDYPHSVSFGHSLSAGCFHDRGSCAGIHMLDKKYNYALCVPFISNWKDIFLIPPVTTIDTIMQDGEKPHPRAKCIKKKNSFYPRVDGYENYDYVEPATNCWLYTTLDLETYREKINQYQSARVVF